MCGIIGYIGGKPVLPVLIDGLRCLEYRGYDSSGVALVRDGLVEIRRSPGKLGRLEDVLVDDPVDGQYGLGHTRWATHGRPTEENAHPHRDCTGRIVVVHNGIIENYVALKQELQAAGHRFVTDTDTEIVAHLVERDMQDDGLENAVRRSLLQLRGLFALVLLSADDPEKIVAVRNARRSWLASAMRSSSSHRMCRQSWRTHATWCSWVMRRWWSSPAQGSTSPISRVVPFPRSASESCGTRSWPRRPATSTSCSRRSSSSPGPSARRCSAEHRLRRANCFSMRCNCPTRRFETSIRSSSWPAAPRGMRGWSPSS